MNASAVSLQSFKASLQHSGLVSPAQLAHADAAPTIETLLRSLLVQGVAGHALLTSLCGLAGMPPAPSPMVKAPDAPGAGGVPLATLAQHRAVPFSMQGGQLHIAFVDPTTAARALDLGFPFHRAYLALPDDIDAGPATLGAPASVAAPAAVSAQPAAPAATAKLPAPMQAASPAATARLTPGDIVGLQPGMSTESIDSAGLALPPTPQPHPQAPAAPSPAATLGYGADVSGGLAPGMATEAYDLRRPEPTHPGAPAPRDDSLPPTMPTEAFDKAVALGAEPSPTATAGYGGSSQMATAAYGAPGPSRPSSADDAASALFGDDDEGPASEAATAAPGSGQDDELPVFEPGSHFAGYEIVGPLGRGGMAVVYRARVPTSGVIVALKVMSPKIKEDAEFVERFRREVQACMKIEHEHVMRIFDTGEERGCHWMSLEFIDGGSVEDLVKQVGALPGPLAADIIDQLLDALEAAHSRGIVHRDIKPANLLLTRAGKLKLADFGIARSQDNQTLTQTGFLVGTPAFMSPEQVTEGKVTPKSDLFSVGTVLYQLLAGENPYLKSTVSQCLQAVMVASAPPLFEKAPSSPGPLEELCAQLHALAPHDRPASANAAREIIAGYLAQVRQRYPDLLARAVQSPAVVVPEVREQLAADALLRATALLDAQPPKPESATLKAMEAAGLLAPTHPEVRAVLDRLKRDFNIDPAPTHPAPKVAEVEASLAREPNSAGLVLRAAQMHRAEGNPWRYVFLMRRYLRMRPDDSYSALQLSAVLGPLDGGTGGEAPALSTGVKPLAQASTDTLIKGIKTGGFKAAPPVRVHQGVGGQGVVMGSTAADSGGAASFIASKVGKLVIVGGFIAGVVVIWSALGSHATTASTTLPTDEQLVIETQAADDHQMNQLVAAARRYEGKSAWFQALGAAETALDYHAGRLDKPPVPGPNVIEAHLIRANALLHTKKIDEAKKAVEQALKLCPPGGALEERAQALHKQVLAAEG